MKKILTLLSLTLLTNTAFAQSAKQDYIVTTIGDTLRGRIQLSGKNGDLVRLARSGASLTAFGPAEAQSYGTSAGPMRVSKKSGVDAKPQFMLPLVEGYVRLYKAENEQSEKRYYLQLPGSAYVTEVEAVNNQLTLARSLPGCDALNFGTDEFQRRYAYSTDGMTRLVMAYNTCREPTKPSSISKRPSGLRASVGIKAGVNVSSFDVQAQAYAGLGQQRDALGYQAGVTLNISALTHVSAQVEATYMTLNATFGPYEAYASNVGFPSNSHTLRIKYSQIQVPFLLRYKFGNGVWRPYLNAGPTLGINFGNSSADTYPSTASGVVTEPVEVGKTALGMTAGGGVAIRAAASLISLELRYDRLGESTGTTDYFSNLNRHESLRFDVGIAF